LPASFRLWTVRNNEGNYESTFLKTGRDTAGAYELIQVEVEPKGGNTWHYHKSFDEQFTVLSGELTVGLNGKTTVLKAGETVLAPRNSMHYFHNATASTILIQVKATPAKGLEKSVRIGYGLHNTGQWRKGLLPKNPWHLPLLLGYSETYLPNIPKFIQEPLVNALSKIAQWKGEDKALEVFFK
jgi:quercetin dioxygenase-like cupin family protein